MNDAPDRYNLRADAKPMVATFKALRGAGDEVEFDEPVSGQLEALERAKDRGWTLIGLKAANGETP